jgi:hypothetical protein
MLKRTVKDALDTVQNAYIQNKLSPSHNRTTTAAPTILVTHVKSNPEVKLVKNVLN